MDEDDFDLNTYEGRRGRMQAAITRAFERREGNTLDVLEYGRFMDYSRGSQFHEAQTEEDRNQRAYEEAVQQVGAYESDLNAAYAAGAMDSNQSAAARHLYEELFREMESAGYTYSGSVNFHEQRREAAIRSEQQRQASLQNQANRAASRGQGASVRDLLPDTGRSRRQGESSRRQDQTSRGTHRTSGHHHKGKGKGR
ncbi:hypothetical protein [Streptomyces ziwulingensis]|uniref:Uncharacterized protein n=1 Tax=Streptomyces ziwulingensis TaxID=1045501 RepID=A0ABP9B1F6_9ACTN